MDYAEEYPNCVECPRFQQWQASSSAMNKALERAVITQKLDDVVANDSLDQVQTDIDETYADFLDHPAADNPLSRLEGEDVYTNINDKIDTRREAIQKQGETTDAIARLLNTMADREIRLLAEGCRGPIHIQLFGKTVLNRCGSSMKHYTMTPPPELS